MSLVGIGKDIWRRFALITSVSFSCLLNACGGGGGDGGMQVRFDTSAIQQSVIEGDQFSEVLQVIHATATGVGNNDNVYVGAEVQGAGVLPNVEVRIDTVARTADITVHPDPSLPPGVYSGKLRLLACKDAACTSHLQGSPHAVDFTTTVQRRLQTSVSSLSFAALESIGAPLQRVSVVLPTDLTALTSKITYAGSARDWLHVVQEGPTIIVEQAAIMLAGSYDATLELNSGLAGQPVLSIPVHLEVGIGMVVPSRIDLSVNSLTTAEQMSGAFVVDVAPGVLMQVWQARADEPWLVIDTPIGESGQPVKWHVDPTQFETLANSAVHTVTLTVDAGTQVTPRSVTLSLTKEMAEMQGIDRLAVLAGEPGEVLIFGNHFDQLANPERFFSIAGVTPVSMTRKSDKLISVQVPALAQGLYPVTLTTASGLAPRVLSLQVLAARDRSYAAVPTPSMMWEMVWDPISESAFAVNRASSEVVRYHLTNSAGATLVSQASRAIPGLHNIALSPDHLSLLVLLKDGTLLELSTQDLSTVRSRQTGAPPDKLQAALTLAVTADNRVWYAAGSGGPESLASYDLNLGQLKLFTSMTAPDNFMFYDGPWAGVSGNGQRMLMVQTATVSSQPLLKWDGSDGVLRSLGDRSLYWPFNRYSSDRKGNRWLLNASFVMDFDFNAEGQITLPGSWDVTATALSRDGSRAYAYAVNANAFADNVEPTSLTYKPRIYVYDLSVPAASYPVLGYFELDHFLSCRVLNGSGCLAYWAQMLLTDDDRTAILIGDRNFVVAPIPVSLRGGALTGQPRTVMRVMPGRGPLSAR